MADIIDDANKLAEHQREQALKRRKPEGPPPCGYCHNCNEPLTTGLRWCDLDCRADWERLQRVKADKAGRYYDED